MKKRLLVLAALGVLPLAQAQGQRSQAKKDSSSTAFETLSAAAGLGGGLLSLFASSGGEYRSTEGWCVGSCETGRSNRGGFGFFMNPERSQANARGGATSLLLRGTSERRAFMLETLDDALTRAGLRMVGGRGNRIWFGTDGSNTAFDVDQADVASNDQGSGSISGSLGGTGVPQSGTESSAGDAPSTGCIIASCMLGEWQPTEGSTGGNSMSGAELVLDGSPERRFGTDPLTNGPAMDGDVNTIVNPEPGTVALMVSGLAGLAFVRHRSRKSVK